MGTDYTRGHHVLQLNNGLTLVHHELAATPVVVADIWIKAGAGMEPLEWTGMAHFLEHMIFKGTPTLAPGLFDYLVEAQGGMTNAATSHDYVHFFITIAADRFAYALPHLADLLLHAAIPVDEFNLERQVVLEEIRQAEDDPDWLAFQVMAEQVYPNHPYGRSILGSAVTLEPLSPSEMRCFYQAYYQPEHMTVVITGGISLEQTVEIVSQAFQDFPEPSACPPSPLALTPAIQGVQRQQLTLPYLEQSRLSMAWLGPGIDNLQAGYGLDLIAALLGQGRSSPLVRELREERQLVQDVTTGFALQRDSSLFTIQAWLDRQQVDRVEAIICDRLSEMTVHPIPASHLNRAKRLLSNDYTFSTEAPGQLAGIYGYYSTLARPDQCFAYIPTIQQYDETTLRQLASQYLTPLHYVSTIVHPT